MLFCNVDRGAKGPSNFIFSLQPITIIVINVIIIILIFGIYDNKTAQQNDARLASTLLYSCQRCFKNSSPFSNIEQSSQ